MWSEYVIVGGLGVSASCKERREFSAAIKWGGKELVGGWSAGGVECERESREPRCEVDLSGQEKPRKGVS